MPPLNGETHRWNILPTPAMRRFSEAILAANVKEIPLHWLACCDDGNEYLSRHFLETLSIYRKGTPEQSKLPLILRSCHRKHLWWESKILCLRSFWKVVSFKEIIWDETETRQNTWTTIFGKIELSTVNLNQNLNRICTHGSYFSLKQRIQKLPIVYLILHVFNIQGD